MINYTKTAQKADTFQYATTNRKKSWRMLSDMFRQWLFIAGILLACLLGIWFYNYQEIIVLAIKNNEPDWIIWPDFKLWIIVVLWVAGMLRFGYYIHSSESDSSTTKERVKEGRRILAPAEGKKEILDYYKQTNQKPHVWLTKNIPSSAQIEGLHRLIVGPTGSGKTTLEVRIIQQLLEHGEKVICFDPQGILLSYLGDKYKTYIVGNPYDERCLYTPLFDNFMIRHDGALCLNKAELGGFSATIFPEGMGESSEFFNTMGRIATTDILHTLSEYRNERGYVDVDYESLLNFIHQPRGKFQEILNKAGRNAAAKIHGEGGAHYTAQSQGHDTTFIKHFEGYDLMAGIADNKPFSIRNWLTSKEPSILFIPSEDQSQFKELQNIQATILSNIIRMSMKLGQINGLNVSLFVSEIDQLKRMPILLDAATKLRNYGVKLTIDVQSLSLFRANSGQDFVDTLTENLQTKVIFGTTGKAAQYWSEQFSDNIKTRQNISLNTTEDENKRAAGQTFATHEETSGVVRKRDITDLRKYEAIFQLPDMQPVKDMTEKVSIGKDCQPFVLNDKFLGREI